MARRGLKIINYYLEIIYYIKIFIFKKCEKLKFSYGEKISIANNIKFF